MKVVIPTAGYGTRLRPHTWSKPKPLISVAGKPVLGHVLDMFATLPRLEEVIFIVGYLGGQIEAYVRQTYPQLRCRYVEQPEMLGQSHAIWLAREGLTGPMLMVFVDTLIEADLTNIEQPGVGALAWVKQVPDPRRFGVAEVGADGWVTRLVEKSASVDNNLAVVGFYYFERSEDLISAIEQQMARNAQLKGEFFLVDAINIMLEQGLRMRTRSVQIWQDCGKAESLLETNAYLLDHGRDNSDVASKRNGVVVVPPVFIDPSADVSESVIGPHVSIGPECSIRRSVLRNSIVDAGSHIVDTTLSASLIGREARVIGRDRILNVGDSSEVGFS